MSEAKASVVAGGISAEDLKSILSTVIVEARKPVVTEKELREEAERLNARAANAQLVKDEMRNKAARQAACSHLRRDGSSRMVYVQGSGTDVDASNYLICQLCQKLVFANGPNADPATFNRHVQMTGNMDIMQ